MGEAACKLRYTCPITNNMLKNIITLVLCAFEVLNCRREPKGNGPNYWGLHMASILFLLTSSVGFNYSKLCVNLAILI